MFNLIANYLDQSDIPFFLMISNSIRTYSQTSNDFVVAFNDEGPSFIHPDILNIFGTKKNTSMDNSTLLGMSPKYKEMISVISL